MTEGAPGRPWLGGVAVTAVFAIGWAAFGTWHQTADFTQLWAITHASWARVSPYDEAGVAALVPRGSEWPVLPWAYPPWTGLLLSPLGLLPLDVASRAWSLGSAGALMLAGAVVVRSERLRTLAVASALGALSLPALGVVVVGQLVAPVALGAALLVARRGPTATAVGLVLLSTKPHLGAPIALAHGGWCALARDRAGARGWAFGAASGLALALASFGLDPRWPVEWPAAVGRLAASDTLRACDTCASATHAAAGSPAGWTGLAALAVLAVVAAARRRDLWRAPDAVVSAGVLAALVFLPYVRNYDHVLLAVPLLAAGLRAGRAGRVGLAAAWALPWLGVAFGRAAGTPFYWLAAVGVAAVWATLPAGPLSPGTGTASPSAGRSSP